MKFSIYNGVHDNQGVTASFDAVFSRIRTGGNGLDEKTRLCRVLFETDKDAYEKIKLALPAVTWAGTFTQRNAQRLIEHSGYIVIDIDHTDVGFILAELSQRNDYKIAFISPSGKGIKIVVQVSPIPTSPIEHKAAFLQVCEDFSDLDCMIDPSGSDVSRLCFLCHDPQALIRQKTITHDWDFESVSEIAPPTPQETEYHGDVDLSALDVIHPDENYQTWLQVGMALKTAGMPLSVWDTWSQQGAKYDAGEMQAKWDSFKGAGITWGTVVHIAREKGWVPQRKSGTPKLHCDNTTEAKTLESLEQNRENRAQATDDFLSQHSKLLHIQLVKDFTGTGKSHTALAKAKQYGKRTLAQLPHTELARQAVDLAYELGFTNPFHLVGREQNWHESGIAKIPPQDRTDALFAQNNCLMVDVVQAYQEKRLAPRTYCESRCEFREDCVYLSQYEGLGERDFLTTCTPNLLFDLNMRGFLVSLVTSNYEPTGEDFAIDAILGTTSERVNDFDYAIIDDYGINGLYWDVSFRESEFKALKTAWKGTPTSEFAKGILRAFDKEKPSKIFKALRKAYTASREHHAEIAKSLTQHARKGIIEYLDQPKGSKETKRLLTEKHIRYVDGGTQLIPVSFEAHQELTDKGLPSVHPAKLPSDTVGEEVIIAHAAQKALSAGIPLDNLTPVWQSGATPIELLQTLISSVGKAKNAPVNLERGVISFSLPPQAPIGLLPHVTMLSATTEIEDAKRPFEGQAVIFSEHAGLAPEWADGVQVYQFQDARLTSASVFNHPKDVDGKRKLQEKPTSLTTTAEEKLRKLNDWAKSSEGKTAFISFKEFAEKFTEAVDGFDVISHFDKVAGLNFGGLKYLIVFGYPKVKHEVVISFFRKQYAGSSDPLPSGNYDDLTETATFQEEGFTIHERRYTDKRLEKIRHQLSTEKLQQAVGRARLPVWKDTTTIIFTDAPVPGITNRATLFTEAAFNLAKSPNDIAEATERITEAEDAGNIQAVMETQAVSQRTAYTRTKDTRKLNEVERDARIIELHKAGTSQRKIERILKREAYKKASRKVISKVVQNCNR